MAQPADIEFRAGATARESARPSGDSAQAHSAPTLPVQWDGEGAPLSSYALQPEQVHPFDPARMPRSHRVAANETLSDIATMYQVPVLALIQENGLQPPYALSPGQEVRLPQPQFHTVGRNETLADIARRYSIDTRSLALLNRMQRPYSVRPGQRIVLPAGMGNAQLPADAPPPAPAPTASGSARFALPLRGEIAARFGARQEGGRLDGIEIAGREGDPIAAAGDGDVVYAGEDVPGYGALVLIRHANNYVTAYGYNRRALVREGQRVRSGQPIAELGLRADGRAVLLFQVRLGSTAVDPAPLIGLVP